MQIESSAAVIFAIVVWSNSINIKRSLLAANRVADSKVQRTGFGASDGSGDAVLPVNVGHEVRLTDLGGITASPSAALGLAERASIALWWL